MKYIQTALYCEAKPIIKHLGLKKETACKKFQVFKDENYILIVSGTGSYNASIALTYVLTLYGCDGSVAVNAGIAGLISGIDESIGKLYVGNRISASSGVRPIYTDPMIVSDIPEASVMTYSKVANERFSGDDCILSDMESYGFCAAASKMIGASCFAVLKTVSDIAGNTSNITPLFVEKLIENNIEAIIGYTDKLSELNQRKTAFIEDDIDEAIGILPLVRLSVSNREILKQHIRYACLHRGITPIEICSTLASEGRNDIHDIRKYLLS